LELTIAAAALSKMPPRGNKKPPVRSQYFNSVKEQKLDTLRWCLKHGGMSTRAEDDAGHTALQIAAAGGFHNALEVLIEHVKKIGDASEFEEPDDDGRTPLMMAAYNGKLECVHMLVLKAKVPLGTKDEAGKTARDYASARKHDKVVAFLDNPKEPVVEDDDDDDEEEGEQQAKARVFKASLKLANATNKQEEVHKAKVEAAEALQAALAAAPDPVWPEVQAVLKETRRELSLRGKAPLSAASPLDPAIFNCVCLQELRIELTESSLASLPAQLSQLHALTTLIVSNNALTALPSTIGELGRLRNLEAASNQIAELPSAMSNLTQLQVIDFTDNKLSSIAPLQQLTELVSLKVGSNQLTELELSWPSLQHMGTLAAPKNEITKASPGLGELQMLVSLDLAHNKIQQIPIELGKLNVKKLQSVRLQGNPLADPRIRRFVEQDEPTLVKDLLNHVRKHGFKGEEASGKKGGGGKKGKKGKKAAKAESSDEEEGDASIAELLAAMGKGSDEED